MGRCAFSTLGGVPGQGLHAPRFAGVAIVDVLGTLAAAAALARWRGWPFWVVAAALFALGVAAHRAFCVRTAVDRLLFG